MIMGCMGDEMTVNERDDANMTKYSNSKRRPGATDATDATRGIRGIPGPLGFGLSVCRRSRLARHAGHVAL